MLLLRCCCCRPMAEANCEGQNKEYRTCQMKVFTMIPAHYYYCIGFCFVFLVAQVADIYDYCEPCMYTSTNWTLDHSPLCPVLYQLPPLKRFLEVLFYYFKVGSVCWWTATLQVIRYEVSLGMGKTAMGLRFLKIWSLNTVEYCMGK